VNLILVLEWLGDLGTIVAYAVVDEGHGLNVEVQRGIYGHKREYGHSVEHEPPLDTLLSAMDGVEERHHALEEQ